MTSTDVVRRDDPELNRLARLGEWLAAAESGRDDPTSKGASAALRLYYAQALGLPPLAALEISIIKGRLVPTSQLLRAMADDAGLIVARVAVSKTSCTARLVNKQTGELVGESTFTLEQAKQAGLVRPNSNWTTYPERMLWARASGFVIRDYAPKVALGMTFQDEVEEVTGKPYDVDVDPVEPDDEGIEFGPGPSEPLEEPQEPLEQPAPAVDDTAAIRGRLDATEPQFQKIHSLCDELNHLETLAGLDTTDWHDWANKTGGENQKLTRARASYVIEQLLGEVKRLTGLMVP
jgi:hypothetical protein